jgi:glycosyltransferase involved in cell wall biosynthesis
MRIGIDGRALRATTDARGVAVYLERLLRELVRQHPKDEYHLLVPGGARPGALLEGVEVVERGRSGRALQGAASIVGRPRLDDLLGGPDLVWLPAPVPVALSRDVPYVLTVHDLSFVHQPRDFSAYERLWHRLARPNRLATRARRVLTDTEAVRTQVIEEWALSPERVRAVRLGPGRAEWHADSDRGAERPAVAGGLHVLAVGALEPRKLPLVLTRAHALARERGLQARLVFAGDGPLRGEVEASGATVLGHVADAELDAAYGQALCLACVSREEGFGFTPLEALAAGAPPVVSDLPVFAETLGDAALVVPADDVEALAGALLRLEGDPELRSRLVEAGRTKLGELSWERAARGTRAVFEEAIG